MWIIGNVGSLDGIIKQQRVSDYRIHFQVPISQPNISLSTPALTHTHTHTHTSHTLALTHSQGSYAVCNLPPTRWICGPKCQIWDCPNVSQKMNKCTNRKRLSKVHHTLCTGVKSLSSLWYAVGGYTLCD